MSSQKSENGIKAQSIDLAWVVVKNFDEALKFYQETLGLELRDSTPEYKWAELSGPKGGALLGICEICEESPVNAGDNAVVSISVENLDDAKAFVQSKGAKLIGDIQEIPGHVKMQLIEDPSGNLIHLVQKLF